MTELTEEVHNWCKANDMWCQRGKIALFCELLVAKFKRNNVSRIEHDRTYYAKQRVENELTELKEKYAQLKAEKRILLRSIGE